MTRVRVYDIGTGHVQTIRTYRYRNHDLELQQAERLVTRMIAQDHGTDTVYYVDDIKEESL